MLLPRWLTHMAVGGRPQSPHHLGLFTGLLEYPHNIIAGFLQVSDPRQQGWSWNVFFLVLFTLQYCTGFAIHWHDSAMGIHEFPILNPPLTSLLIPSLWVIPVHQHQESCICVEPRLVIRFLHDIIHVWMPFSQIIPPSPSPTESERLFYTSVSPLLSLIQGSHYHLSKFHIYVLVYCVDTILSGLLHSV